MHDLVEDLKRFVMTKSSLTMVYFDHRYVVVQKVGTGCLFVRSSLSSMAYGRGVLRRKPSY